VIGQSIVSKSPSVIQVGKIRITAIQVLMCGGIFGFSILST